MSSIYTAQRKTGGLWVTVCFSALIHLAVFFFIQNFQFYSNISSGPTYYVDILDLPVANPQAGTSHKGESGPPLSAASPPPKQEMALPAKPSPRQAKAKPEKSADSKETAREFEDRIRRIEQEASARHEATALEAVRKRVAGSRTVGIPGGTGNEAGSDYPSYIRSRLEDAFRMEDTFKPDPGKVVVVKIVIDRNGRIILPLRYEKRSNDQMFNDAVSRAIARAEKEFKRPPGGGQIECGFVFKPQGVGKK